MYVVTAVLPKVLNIFEVLLFEVLVRYDVNPNTLHQAVGFRA